MLFSRARSAKSRAMSSWELCKDEWERKLQAARKEVEVARARLEAHRRKVALERKGGSRNGGSSENVSRDAETSPVVVDSVPEPPGPCALLMSAVSPELLERACDRDSNAFEQADPAGGDTGGAAVECEAEAGGFIELAVEATPLSVTREPVTPSAKLEPIPVARSRELGPPAAGVPQEGTGNYVSNVWELAEPTRGAAGEPPTRGAAGEPPVEGEFDTLGPRQPVAPPVAPHADRILTATRPSARCLRGSPRQRHRAKKTALSSGTTRGRRRRLTGHVAGKSTSHHFGGKGVKLVAAPTMPDRLPPSKKPQLVKVGQGDAPSFTASAGPSRRGPRKHAPDQYARDKAEHQFQSGVGRFYSRPKTKQLINVVEPFWAIRCLFKSELWLYGT